MPLTDLVPFCEQRTGRIICSFYPSRSTPPSDQLNLLNISKGESKELVKNPTLQPMNQSKMSRRRVASDARTRAREVQNIEEEITKLVQDPLPLPLPQQSAKMTPQRLPNAQSPCDVRGWPGGAI